MRVTSEGCDTLVSTRNTTSSGISTSGTPRNTFCWERWGSVPVNIPQIWCLDRRVAMSVVGEAMVSVRRIQE